MGSLQYLTSCSPIFWKGSPRQCLSKSWHSLSPPLLLLPPSRTLACGCHKLKTQPAPVCLGHPGGGPF